MKTNEVIEELTARNKPVKRLMPPSVRLLYWFFISVLSVAAWIWYFGFRSGISVSIRNLSFWLESLPLLGISILSGYVALALGVPGSTSTRQLKRLGLFSLLVWSIAFLFGLPYRGGNHESIWAAGPGSLCVESIFELSLLPAFLLLWMIKNSMPTYPGFNGTAALLAASSLAAWGTQWICPFEFPLHFLVWHLIPSWVIAMMGYWIGSMLLKWKPWNQKQI